MVSFVIQMLISKPHKSLENACNNNDGSVGKSYSQVHEGYGRFTPGQCSWNCSRRERVQAKVQRLKTGPIQLREHTATEKFADPEASREQPQHYTHPATGRYPIQGTSKDSQNPQK